MGKEQIIEGVIVQELKQIPDERGRIMHMLRIDNPLFEKFGEVYFSEILPGVVKAWKRHKKMTQIFAVPIGKIKLVIYDDRENSISKGNLTVLEIGRDNYQLVKIPPRLWYGFKCISEHPALLANCTDLPHDPNEVEDRDPHDSYVLYQW
ncbi:dTDP-4-dehydrorhamnose 3,5-epimerase family protein [bacterium]|nr:dTDP-4-dehydrorhamnose 3,5-epimerase family protein [bacterium]